MRKSQIKAGIIFSYASSIIQFVILFAYTPFLLKSVGQSEYGVYSLAQSVVGYLSLLGMGLNSSYVRFYMRYKVNKDDEGIAKLNGMFLLIFSVISILAVVIGAILVMCVGDMFGANLTVEEIHKMRIVMSLMIINTGTVFISTVFVCNINANERYVFQKTTYALFEYIICTLACVVALLVGGKGIAITAIRVIVFGLYTLVCVKYCIKNLKMNFKFRGIDLKMFREICVFSGIIFINIIVDQLNWSVDKLILGAMSGTTAVAIYGVASQLNNAYISCSTTISSVFAPSINKMVAQNDDNGLNVLFTRVGRIQFMLMSLVCTGFIFFGQDFINIWVGKGYEQAYAIGVMLMLCITIPLCQNLGIEIQRGKNKHRFRAYVYLGIAILNTIISILLCPKYGAIGCAFGTAVSMILGQIIIMNIHYHKRIGINIIAFWKSILKILPSFVLPIAVGILMNIAVKKSDVVTLAIKICIYTLVYYTSVRIFAMNKSEKELLDGMIGRILPKGKKKV